MGCCGRGNNKNTQNTSNNRAPINMNYNSNTGNNCMPGANGGDRRGRQMSSHHDEEICHGTGERRRDLLDQVKIYLNEFDDRPCSVTPPQRGPNALRPLGSYPEYMKKHCQSWMPPNPRPPLITSVQVHEIRATSDYDKLKGDISEYVSFVDASPKPPVQTCDCVKRNGLQDECPHPMCKPPTAQCKANNPGPCCPPSLGMGGPPATLGKPKGAQGDTARGAGAQAQGHAAHTEYQDTFLNQQLPMSPHSHLQDFPDQQQYRSQQRYNEMPLQQHHLGAAVPRAPPGMDVVCICKSSPYNRPTGKKYLCCPVPVQQ